MMMFAVNFKLLITMYLNFISFVNFIHYKPAYKRDNKQYCKQNKCLPWNHGQHDKRFITRRTYHRSYESTEADKSMGKKRDRGKPSHTARYESENRTEKDL